MNQELKDAIIKAVQDNKDDFQLVNYITNLFKQYIYQEYKGEYKTREEYLHSRGKLYESDSNGSYCIGGEKVAQFINDFIKLYINE